VAVMKMKKQAQSSTNVTPVAKIPPKNDTDGQSKSGGKQDATKADTSSKTDL
jgi:hypothetical protein